jgi:hypothetical protein
MPGYAYLLAGLLAAGPAVTVVPLTGEPQTGALSELTAEAVVLEAAAGAETIDLDSLRSLQFEGVEPPDEFADPPAAEVVLTDGTRLAATAFASQLMEATIDVELIGPVRLPRSALRAVRLASPEKVTARWSELLERENAADMLVVRKQDALDFVEGTAGDVGATEITFLLDGQSRTLPRERAFGIIYARPTSEPPRPTMVVHVGRSSLQSASLSLDPSQATAALAAGPLVPLPRDAIRSVEFSGRVRFLGDLTPAVELPSGVAVEEQYRYFRRGTEPFGAPLRIGADEIIARDGLWMHSGVTARYRINRDYRRLAALVGMDHNVAGNRQVRLVISGDGQPLFDETIAWTDDAREIDLDVSGVRDLEIEARRTEDSLENNLFGIQEHLDLGNIRLIR